MNPQVGSSPVVTLGACLGLLALVLFGCGSSSDGGASAGAPAVVAVSGAAGVSAGQGGSGAGSAGTSAGGASGEPSNGDAGMAGEDAGGSAGAPPLAPWHLYGRWHVQGPKRAVTVNSGSHVTARFSGTGIAALFDVTGNTGAIPTVAWKVDDAGWKEAEISASLPLAKGLASGTHELTLFVRGMDESDERWTPPLVASTVFLGFAVTSGTLQPTARPERLKLEFLGDSITEGVRVHSAGPAGQTSKNWLADARLAYPSVTAGALGAEWRQVGFGRQGLTVVAHGGVPKAQDSFDWIYSGVPRDDWQPDIVVINEGTNDRGSTGEVFRPLYGQYLDRIRTAYPEATLVALEPFVGAFGSEISAEIETRRAAGDLRLVYVDTTGWTGPSDFTDGLHPNQTGSQVIRGHLVPVLEGLRSK